MIFGVLRKWQHCDEAQKMVLCSVAVFIGKDPSTLCAIHRTLTKEAMIELCTMAGHDVQGSLSVKTVTAL